MHRPHTLCIEPYKEHSADKCVAMRAMTCSGIPNWLILGIPSVLKTHQQESSKLVSNHRVLDDALPLEASMHVWAFWAAAQVFG